MAQRLAGLFVGIAGHEFVDVSGALRLTKTQQQQFPRTRDLRAAVAVHAALVSYHHQRIRSLRASWGRADNVRCATEKKKRALEKCVYETVR